MSDKNEQSQARVTAPKEPAGTGGTVRPIEHWRAEHIAESKNWDGGVGPRTAYAMARAIMGWAQNTHTTRADYEAAIDRALGARVQ